MPEVPDASQEPIISGQDNLLIDAVTRAYNACPDADPLNPDHSLNLRAGGLDVRILPFRLFATKIKIRPANGAPNFDIALTRPLRRHRTFCLSLSPEGNPATQLQEYSHDYELGTVYDPSYQAETLANLIGAALESGQIRPRRRLPGLLGLLID